MQHLDLHDDYNRHVALAAGRGGRNVHIKVLQASKRLLVKMRPFASHTSPLSTFVEYFDVGDGALWLGCCMHVYVMNEWWIVVYLRAALKFAYSNCARARTLVIIMLIIEIAGCSKVLRQYDYWLKNIDCAEAQFSIIDLSVLIRKSSIIGN